MLPEPSPSSIDTAIDIATGDLARVLRDLVSRLREEHQAQLEAAVAGAREESARAHALAVDNAVATARTELERAHALALEQAVADARAEADQARDLAVEDAATQARAAFEQTHEESLQQAVKTALAGARAEWDEQRSLIEEQHAAALQALEVTLRSESQRVALAHASEAEQRVREEMRASIADVVAEAEQRGRLERDEASARATSGVTRREPDDPAPDASAPGSSTGVGERESRLEMIERVLEGIERLDAASSLRAALDALADAVAAEAPRSLVFTVRGGTLRGWRASGLPAGPAGFPSLEIPLGASGPLATAVSSLAAVPVHANAISRDTAGALEWLGLADDQAGLAVPVAVDGRAVALVYADDGAREDREVPGSWPESVQLLARHAARVLEVLTARRAAEARLAAAQVRALAPAPAMTPDEARHVARLVVSDVRVDHESEFRLGLELHDLRTRLAGPIARAHRLYDQRVPTWLAGRDDIFEDELRRALVNGSPALVGQPGNATT
jgi:hypothetical protein